MISWVSNRSKQIKDQARSFGYKGIVAGTRKTTPGFRLVEKYGMLVGGIDPHRHDLSSMIMLKDNHIWSSGFVFSLSSILFFACLSRPPQLGSITAAINQARKVGGFSLLLEVEVGSESEADEAIDAGADIIMLDNIEGDQLVQVARRLREKWTGKRKFLFESSGNITESNLQERAINGECYLSQEGGGFLFSGLDGTDVGFVDIDILSTSAVHQSVQHIDFSLKIQKE